MTKSGLILDALSIQDLKDLARKAEHAGFHSIWATELYRTSFQQLSAAAEVTDKIKLGSAVALAFTRSPLITALTSLDLDEISGGRLILGLGTGAKNTNERYHGIMYGKPVKRISECVEIIRNYISSAHKEDIFKYDGEYYKLNTKGYKRAFQPMREKVPIYMAGIGRNMIQKSAEIADGYLGHVVCNLDYIKGVVKPSIDLGLSISNRNREDFIFSSIITCAISNDIEKARYAAKATIGFYATVKTYRAPFEMMGYTEQVEKIRNSYFKNDIGEMIENVSDEMVEKFAVIGDARTCRDKIERYREYLDLPILSAPHYFIDYDEVKEFQDSILSTFGS